MVYCLGGSVKASPTKGNNLNGNVMEAVYSVQIHTVFKSFKPNAQYFVPSYLDTISSVAGGGEAGTTESAPGLSGAPLTGGGISGEAQPSDHIFTDAVMESQIDIRAVQNLTREVYKIFFFK